MAIFKIAKTAGFCYGVKRAIDTAISELKNNNEIYSFGPIIHNERVINDLNKMGLKVINDDPKNIKNKNIIIRSHGIEKENLLILQKNNNKIIDLTCPYVKKIHNLVNKYSNDGYHIIVIGDKEHIEVKGIVSYANGKIDVINDINDVNYLAIDKNDKVLIVFQTTYNIQKSKKFIEILTNLFYNCKVINTICNATDERQNEVLELSKECDIFLIIGSKTSSNTNKLTDIAKENCKRVYLISEKNDIDRIIMNKNSIVGVSAGASAPNYLIEEILMYARTKF